MNQDEVLAWLAEKAQQQADAADSLPPSIGKTNCETAADALNSARNLIEAQGSKLPYWRSLADDPPPHAKRCLLTNNIKALDAHGLMSHIWIGFPIMSSEHGYWVTFDEGDRKIHSLTHWMPLPEPPHE